MNVIGLRRAGFTVEQRLELKRLYHLLFRSALKRADAIAAGRAQCTTDSGRLLLDFVATAQRGVCRDRGARGEDLAEED